MESQVRILAIGSPHGDDRIGWHLAARLERHGDVVPIVRPTDLLDCLDDCDTVVLIDACVGGGRPGQVICREWPDPLFDACGGGLSHTMDVGSVLRLAETLGRLPRRVVLLAVEIDPGRCRPLSPLSELVERAVPAVEARMRREIENLSSCSGNREPCGTRRPGRRFSDTP